MVYLAVPIKHPDPEVVKYRITVANQVAARLHDADIAVFSPASHSGEFIKHCEAPVRGWDYWSRIDLPILTRCCTTLAVLCLAGWEESEGMSAEIYASRENRIRIVYIDLCEMCGSMLDQDGHAPELIKWNHAPVPCLTELLKIAA